MNFPDLCGTGRNHDVQAQHAKGNDEDRPPIASEFQFHLGLIANWKITTGRLASARSDRSWWNWCSGQ